MIVMIVHFYIRLLKLILVFCSNYDNVQTYEEIKL
jgi:hypothetical protein